jgi:hypothetical protein
MAVDINGDGLIALGGTSTTQGRVRLAEDTDNGTNYVELTSNAAVTTNRTVTFPDADINFTTGLGAAQGGTGANTLTSENVIIGNGTSAVKFVAPGTTGNVLTSNGSAWLSQAAAGGGDYIMQVFTTPGTWTKAAGLKAIKVTVVGGGGGTAGFAIGLGSTQGGAGGGTAIEYIDAPAIPGPQPYTVAAATPSAPSPSYGASGNSSSFGSPAFLSATGGTGVIGPANTRRAGGSGSGGQLNIPGQEAGIIPGGGCANYASSGGSMFGFGVALLANQSPGGNPGASYGYGAGGAGTIPGPGLGQPGGPGVIIVEEFY